jgi:hypothetical protein
MPTPPFTNYKELPLSEAVLHIKSADHLLFRGKGLVSRGISAYTLDPHTHAAKASWANGQLECVEVREFKGGRIVTLLSQVENFPGQIDVFRSNDIGLPEWTDEEFRERYVKPLNGHRDQRYKYKELIRVVSEYGKGRYCRQGADLMMRGFAGCDYGWWSIFTTGVCNLPVLRFMLTGDYDDNSISKYPPFCSAASAIADRLGGGFDQVRGKSDAQTTPGDIRRTPFNGYLFTLIPDPNECD